MVVPSYWTCNSSYHPGKTFVHVYERITWNDKWLSVTFSCLNVLIVFTCYLLFSIRKYYREWMEINSHSHFPQKFHNIFYTSIFCKDGYILTTLH